MGQYKVPQDVEAEDKIIGFLTLKQFIYSVVGLMWGVITFQIFKAVPFIFAIVGVPPAFILLLLGLYQRQGQPFEAYFLALVSFYFKPRRRLWHKDPIVEVFKLEAPKITEDINQRDPEQVRSQLEQIAAVVDTRGWTAKKAEVQEPEAQPAVKVEERLAVPAAEAVAAPAAGTEVELSDDILDFQNNPSAQNLNVLIEDAVKNIREEALVKMKAAPSPSTSSGSTTSVSEMTKPAPVGIIKLAMDNDDLTVSQIANQAQKQVVMSEGQAVSLRPDGGGVNGQTA